MVTGNPREVKILAEIANIVYDWLPGSAPFGKTYTFADAASSCGLSAFWPDGSKRPAIQNLLQGAWSHGLLGSLLLRITTEGIKYRERKGNSLTKEEVEAVNELLLHLKLKVPQLHDPEFLSSLATRGTEKSANAVSRSKLEDLLRRYYTIERNPDLQSRGYEFQSLLVDLFNEYSLQARGTFRVTGQEIDGSFVLDSETYLLEARWRKEKADFSALASFSSKVESKSAWTRGLFVSIAGFSDDAMESMTKGKAPGFVLMSGDELVRALKAEIGFLELLREKVRLLAERGKLG